MESSTQPRLVSVDRLDSGIVITFSDGKSALFSASLLYATLPQARELNDQGEPL